MKDTDLKWLNNYYNTCDFPIKTGIEALKSHYWSCSILIIHFYSKHLYLLYIIYIYIIFLLRVIWDYKFYMKILEIRFISSLGYALIS